MKKSILTIAVLAASVVAPAAMAAPTVYGNVHLAIVDQDSKDNLDLTSNTSAIGVKGSEDVGGGGMKAIYKLEWQVDVSDGGTNGSGTANLVKRDQFVGLKGGVGTIKFGTFSSNYKQKGGAVDSLYRTPVEGRGLLQTQSRLHNGRDINRGRMTNAVAYTTPKMGGFALVLNTTLSNAEDETTGAGIRWSNKSFLAFLDWIDAQPGNAVLGNGAVNPAGTESAMKIGGKYKGKKWHIGGQYEDSEDLTAYNYLHVNGGFNFNKNNSVELTLGTASHITNGAIDTDSFAVAYNHKLSKMTNLYVAYGDRSSDTAAAEDSALAFGIKKKF